MMRSVFSFAAFCALSVSISATSALATTAGTITSPVFSYNFGSAPGTDLFDFSGTYALGSGATPFNLPTDQVTLSFDGGRFSQTLPANSFTCTSTTCTYSNTGASGITNFQIKKNLSTFSISVRKADFTGTKPQQMGVLSFSVGTNTFAFTPNSMPVAHVTGPHSATVGTLLTFDATTSTDFNSNSLTFTWAIVSQPLGSSAALSSTNQATTSLTVTRNGAYVLKVTPNDGIVNGIPALIAVNVSGGTAPTPPAPGPDNGLVVLSADQTSYIAGTNATLSLHVNVPDGNAQRRYYFVATFDDQPVALTVVNNQLDYSYVAVALSAGSHTFKVLQYTETTDIANDLTNAIAGYNTDIANANKALQYETDPAQIASLQAQVAADQQQIAIDQDQLTKNRTQVAGPAVLTVSAQ
ncbi:MAG: hypothetical protein ACXWR1_02610 [Bdellovibrionota bacterium]